MIHRLAFATPARANGLGADPHTAEANHSISPPLSQIAGKRRRHLIPHRGGRNGPEIGVKTCACLSLGQLRWTRSVRAPPGTPSPVACPPTPTQCPSAPPPHGDPARGPGPGTWDPAHSRRRGDHRPGTTDTNGAPLRGTAAIRPSRSPRQVPLLPGQKAPPSRGDLRAVCARGGPRGRRRPTRVVRVRHPRTKPRLTLPRWRASGSIWCAPTRCPPVGSWMWPIATAFS